MPKRARQGKTEESREFRIIAGEFRGRRLGYPSDPGLRPMKDRTREALFNRLRNCIEGMHAVDLFAGTGAVGLEALSRGAVRLTAWEVHSRNAQALRHNITRLDASDRAHVFAADVFPCATRDDLRDLLESDAEGGSAPWCVFCCPPYEMYESRPQELMDLLANLLRQAPPDSVFVVESEIGWNATLLPDAAHWDAHNYAPATLHIHWPEEANS